MLDMSALLKVTSAEISRRRWSQPLWIRRKINVGIKYGLLLQYHLSAMGVWQSWNWEMSMGSWNGRRGLSPARLEAAPTGLPEMVLLYASFIPPFLTCHLVSAPFLSPNSHGLDNKLCGHPISSFHVSLFKCSHLELSCRHQKP